MTTPIKLVQEPGRFSILIMFPLYRKDARLFTIEEKRAGLVGFINASYRAEIWLAKALGRLNRQDIEIFLYAEDEGGASQGRVPGEHELAGDNGARRRAPPQADAGEPAQRSNR